MCPSMYLSDSGSETSDAVHIIKVGIIQAVAAVAVFFFIYVGDPKHLLSQTQKFNNVFLRKMKKGGLRRVNSSSEKQRKPEKISGFSTGIFFVNTS